MFVKSRLINLLILILIAVFGGIFGAFFYDSTMLADNFVSRPDVAPAKDLLRSRFKNAGFYSPSDVVRLNIYAAPSIGAIYPKKSKKIDTLDNLYLPQEKLGVSFVLTADGWLVSHPSIFKRATPDKLIIQISKNFYEIEKVAIDELRQVAYIKITASNLNPLKFADSDDIRLGDQLFVVAGKNKLTTGIVSSLHRKDYINRLSLIGQSEKFDRYLSFEDTLATEFLGAPVTNLNGEVLGLVSRTSVRGEALVTPINNLNHSIAQLLDGKKFTNIYLGLSYIDLNHEEGAVVNNRGGFLIYANSSLGVKAVFDESSAESAGLRSGDIILRVNNEYARGPLALSEILDNFKPEEEISLTILRDGNEIAVRVKLEER